MRITCGLRARAQVCIEMGYKVSMRDIENMIAVMSPTQLPPSAGRSHSDDGGGVL